MSTYVYADVEGVMYEIDNFYEMLMSEIHQHYYQAPQFNQDIRVTDEMTSEQAYYTAMAKREAEMARGEASGRDGYRMRPRDRWCR